MFAKGSISRKLLYVAGSGAVLVLAGGYVTYKRRLNENKSCNAEEFNATQNKEDLLWALSHITSANEAPRILFYRYSTCPFCGTVKSFLDYNKIRHECVEVEPMFKREISMNAYKKVPQVKFCVSGRSDPFIVDSEIIVDTIAKHVGMGKQIQDPEVVRWREWARGPMLRLMTVEFNSSLLKSWRAYRYIDDIDTIPLRNKLFLKMVGAPVMYLVARYVTRPRLEKSNYLRPGESARDKLHMEIDNFVKEGLNEGAKKFHGGTKPDLADLDIHGILQAVRGHCVYNGIIASTHIKPWLDRMDQEVGIAKYSPG
ncbi:putative Glutaredoxin [Trypanosoma vivax]|uniref:Putative glutathione-S-transferase/glutaredoxin n=1 Tax=Trypanosoma vivax (strain Y486) TaxID=1055687 RepID=G0TYF8_TRYVY|nr:putative glutathione-S-transferase/glutaredoxin [Trypanosoma vivax]KAH8611683.1 putative Glutaredoxin [Trypanosoma vivax]CCC49005.1 putative glutathione-S-transferase/glutaredoxin [Trypanosoma vivax Y486]